MTAARVNEVRDAIKARIDSAWVTFADAQVTPPADWQRARESEQDEVVVASRWEIRASKLKGRKVYVVRDAVADQPATRGDDEKDFRFAFVVAERYAGSDDPPEEWLDARVEFCEWLLNILGNARNPRLLADPDDPNSGLWPQEAGITTVLDVEELDERKLFASYLSVTFREQAESRPIPGGRYVADGPASVDAAAIGVPAGVSVRVQLWGGGGDGGGGSPGYGGGGGAYAECVVPSSLWTLGGTLEVGDSAADSTLTLGAVLRVSAGGGADASAAPGAGGVAAAGAGVTAVTLADGSDGQNPPVPPGSTGGSGGDSGGGASGGSGGTTGQPGTDGEFPGGGGGGSGFEGGANGVGAAGRAVLVWPA